MSAGQQILVILAVGALCWGSYHRGWDEATAKADADRTFVHEQMDKIGFCGFVLHDFNRYCVAKYRSSPTPPGGSDE